MTKVLNIAMLSLLILTGASRTVEAGASFQPEYMLRPVVVGVVPLFGKSDDPVAGKMCMILRIYKYVRLRDSFVEYYRYDTSVAPVSADEAYQQLTSLVEKFHQPSGQSGPPDLSLDSPECRVNGRGNIEIHHDRIFERTSYRARDNSRMTVLSYEGKRGSFLPRQAFEGDFSDPDGSTFAPNMRCIQVTPETGW